MPMTLAPAVQNGALSRKSHPGKPTPANLCEECAITAISALSDDVSLFDGAVRAFREIELERERITRAALTHKITAPRAEQLLAGLARQERAMEAAMETRACRICGCLIPEIKTIVSMVAA